ncbi:MAG: 30S ribosomal protein S7, partial [Verrucomicrobia bacterium]|nr:30S ribosomal protein S7 [Verrucomicrobiota bacterium]
MSRRRRATKREIIPDPKYHSQLVSRLVTTVMNSGKKSLAERVVYQAFNALAEKNPTSSPLEVL